MSKRFFVISLTSIVFFSFLFLNPTPVSAQPFDPTTITGKVTAPQGVLEYNAQSGGEIGVLTFASQIIFLLNVGAGLFAMYNFLTAGLTYITSAGSSDAHTKVKDKLIYSFVGIALVITSYTAGGLIGLIFFGDAGFLLNPQLQGALEK